MRYIKFCWLPILLLACANKSISQSITTDGQYVCALVDKSRDGSEPVLVLQSVGKRAWKRELPNASEAAFTSDSRYVLYTLKDTLVIHELGTDKKRYLYGVSSYKQHDVDIQRWLFCRLKESLDKLLVYDIRTGKSVVHGSVNQFALAPNGNEVVLLKEAPTQHALEYVYLPSGQTKEIWTGTGQPGTFTFDASGSNLAFYVKDSESTDKDSHSVWHYRSTEPRSRLLVNNYHPDLDSNLVVSDAKQLYFTPDGNRLFFYLREGALPAVGKEKYNVDIWSYLDSRTMDVQLLDKDVLRNYAAVVDIEDGHVVRLERDGELIPAYHLRPTKDVSKKSNNEYTIVCDFDDFIFYYEPSGFVNVAYSFDEYNWNRKVMCDIYLVSVHDGSRKLLKKDVRLMSGNDVHPLPILEFTSTGDRIIYFDPSVDGYFSYAIESEEWTNLTKGTGRSWINGNPRFSARYFLPASSILWEKGGKSFLVQDIFKDIWRFDANGSTKPINLTKGYFKDNELYPIFRHQSPSVSGRIIIESKGEARSRNAYRNSGFIVVESVKTSMDILLPFGGDYQYELKGNSMDRSAFVVTGSSKEEPLATFYTRNFRNIIPITSRLPERRIEAWKQQQKQRELLTWTAFDGLLNHGWLTYTKDFDPGKKYPVIISYYEAPVSLVGPGGENDGYLRFYPDIHMTVGSVCDCAYNSVVSGAQYIAKLPFVDSAKMGIMGISFSGYTTNCLVTRTSIFAAAVSNVGYSNLISGFFNLDPEVKMRSADLEIGQTAVGVTPWERLDLYIENSPVLSANEVKTPLLLASGKLDKRVPYIQNMEMFKALRRLGKQAWFLNWDYLGHDARAPHMVFFDHYLKGAPPAKWMVEGVPARRKGTVDIRELKPEVLTPGPGLLSDTNIRTPAQQKLVDEKPVTYKLP